MLHVRKRTCRALTAQSDASSERLEHRSVSTVLDRSGSEVLGVWMGGRSRRRESEAEAREERWRGETRSTSARVRSKHDHHPVSLLTTRLHLGLGQRLNGDQPLLLGRDGRLASSIRDGVVGGSVGSAGNVAVRVRVLAEILVDVRVVVGGSGGHRKRVL